MSTPVPCQVSVHPPDWRAMPFRNEASERRGPTAPIEVELGCADAEFCDIPVEGICGAADATGICRVRPEACTEQTATDVLSKRYRSELECSSGWQEVVGHSALAEGVGKTAYVKTICRRAKPDEAPRR